MSVTVSSRRTIWLLLLTVLVLLLTVASVPFSGFVSASNHDDPFHSFEIVFESAVPEEPDDVEIEWTLTDDADDVETVEVAIENSSGQPINVYKPNETSVSNPFNVSADGDGSADIVVDDLESVSLSLKIPPGHCDRVENVEVIAYDEDGEHVGDVPNVRERTNCTPEKTGTFDVTILEYDERVVAGEYGNATAEVENVGDKATTQDVRILIDGEEIDVVENVTLAPDQNQTIDVAYETDDGDLPAFDLTVASDDDTATRTVTVDEPAFFDVTIDHAPETVTAGEPIDVVAQVENVGDRNGTQNVTLTNFDGEVVDIDERLDLAPGASAAVDLTWATETTDSEDGAITVHSANDTDATNVTITPVVESIDVSLDETTLSEGDSTIATVNATFGNGSVQTVTDDATLVSNDTSVVTVDDDGHVLAESQGTAVVEATFENNTDTSDTLTVVVDDSETDEGDSDESDQDDSDESDQDDSDDSDQDDADDSDQDDADDSDQDDADDSDQDDADESDQDDSNDSDANGSDDSDQTSGSGGTGTGTGSSDDEQDETADEESTPDRTDDAEESDDGETDAEGSTSGDDETQRDDVDGPDTHDPDGDEGDEDDTDDRDHEDDETIFVLPVLGWLLLVPLLALRN